MICKHCKQPIDLYDKAPSFAQVNDSRQGWAADQTGDPDEDFYCPEREASGRFPDGKPHEPGPNETFGSYDSVGPLNPAFGDVHHFGTQVCEWTGVSGWQPCETDDSPDDSDGTFTEDDQGNWHRVEVERTMTIEHDVSIETDMDGNMLLSCSCGAQCNATDMGEGVSYAVDLGDVQRWATAHTQLPQFGPPTTEAQPSPQRGDGTITI